ncbi:hypothetical protein NC651_013693 [Populus alba x Populus x berolinensis]|nr:hypothetical protein NC651_013693 [Populus alba x Populus x berolinensis]
MAETAVATTEAPTLSEQYLLKGEEEKTNVVSKPVEVKEDEKPATVVSEEIVEKAEEPPAPAAEEKTEDTPAAKALKLPLLLKATVKIPLLLLKNPMKLQKRTQEKKLQKRGGRLRLRQHQLITDSQLRIKQGTALPDTLNIIAAKGEDASECDKFAKYYRSLCPSEWVERWNEQRSNGTFPGPL